MVHHMGKPWLCLTVIELLTVSKVLKSWKGWLKNVVRDMSTVSCFPVFTGISAYEKLEIISCRQKACSIAVSDLPVNRPKSHNKWIHVCKHLQLAHLFTANIFLTCPDCQWNQLKMKGLPTIQGCLVQHCCKLFSAYYRVCSVSGR